MTADDPVLSAGTPPVDEATITLSEESQDLIELFTVRLEKMHRVNDAFNRNEPLPHYAKDAVEEYKATYSDLESRLLTLETKNAKLDFELGLARGEAHTFAAEVERLRAELELARESERIHMEAFNDANAMIQDATDLLPPDADGVVDLLGGIERLRARNKDLETAIESLGPIDWDKAIGERTP